MSKILIKLMFVAVVLLSTAELLAQVPQGFNFQAVARDADGELISNSELGVRITLLLGDEEGTAVYAETQNPTTSPIGTFQIVIGEGTSDGDFSAIDWSSGNYYVKLEIDPAGGEEYEVLGTTRLLSVPYAILARDVVNGNGGIDSVLVTTQYDLNSSEGDTSFIINTTGVSSLAGLRINANTDDQNIGIRSVAISKSSSTNIQVGSWASATGEADANHYGVVGQSNSAGRYNYGVYGTASGAGDGTIVPLGEGPDPLNNFGSYNIAGGFYSSGNLNGNVGVEAQASGNVGERIDFGVIARAIGNSNSPNIGVRAEANQSPVQNVAFEGDASGEGTNNLGLRLHVHNGSSNIGMEVNADTAAIFNGHSVINGDLTVTGNINYSGEIGSGGDSGSGPTQEVVVENENGEVVASINPHGANNRQGQLHLYGSDSGTDNLRAGLEVHDNGSGDTWGSLFLRAPAEDRKFVDLSVWNDPTGSDPSGWTGAMTILGKDSPNFEMGAQIWHDSNFPFFRMFGTKTHADGWFHHQMELSVNKDVDQEWGSLTLFSNEGKHNMTLGAKHWEDASLGAGRPYLQMSGNTPDVNQVWMEVSEWESGLEVGQLNLSSTNNAEFRMNAYGLYGTEVGTGYDRVILEVANNGNGSFGNFALKGPNEDRNMVVTYVNQDNGGWSGFLELSGANSPNINLKSRSWEDANLPLLELYGSKKNVESGDFYQHAILTVNKDGDQQWGAFELLSNDGKFNVSIGAKSWEDPTEGAGRPFMSFRGNTPDQDLIWLDVTADGENEHGGVTFRSTNGTELGINAYGLQGNTDIHGNLHVNGDITYTGSSSQSSDRNLKENIQPLQNGLSTIMKLNPTTYNFRGNGEYNGLKLSTGLHYGLIAQEVEEVLPSLVKNNVHTYSEMISTGNGPSVDTETEIDKTMEYKTLNYTELIPLLIKGMQEQQQLIEMQQKELDELKKKLEGKLK